MQRRRAVRLIRNRVRRRRGRGGGCRSFGRAPGALRLAPLGGCFGIRAGGAVVFLEFLLRNAVKCERGDCALQARDNDAPLAIGAAPAGEFVILDPYHPSLQQCFPRELVVPLPCSCSLAQPASVALIQHFTDLLAEKIAVGGRGGILPWPCRHVLSKHTEVTMPLKRLKESASAWSRV